VSEDRVADADPAHLVYSLVEEAGNGELAVRYRRGEGPAIVYLHGWGRSLGDFVGFLPRGQQAAVALDLPGFGRSSAPSQAIGARGYAELLRVPFAKLRARLGVDRMILVGHSLGGRIAAEFAGIAGPDDGLAGLVLVASPILRPPGGRSPLGYRLVRSLAGAHLLPAATLEWARGRWGSADYREATGVMREILVRMVNEEHVRPLARTDVAVELLWGERDSVSPVWLAERVAERVPGANLVVVPGVGHDVPREAPAEVWAAVERVLARAGAQDGGADA
jgi:pimeloyl-ACP methyl ester carboxylesterase